jgi:hypothetical protein
MASFGIYVPDESDLLDKIQKRADAEHDGKVSAYARAAIERDLLKRDSPDALSPSVIVDLANRLIGEFDAQKVAAALQGKDQREEMQKILRAIIAAAGPATGFVLPALSQKIAEKRAKEAARDGAPHTSESQPTVQR